MSADAVKEWQRTAWGAAPFEPLAQTCAPVHDALVVALGPLSGERLLDVATGTGALALRAAHAGAAVTAVDLAPPMVSSAMRLARIEGVSIRFDVGDAERLPYRDASFDVVASSQGVMFALDAAAAAAELARVCRPGGRLGLSVLAPTPANEALFDAWRAFARRPEWIDDPLDWGRPDVLDRLLGPAFTIELRSAAAPLEAESAEALWQLQRSHCGPLKLLFDSLPPPGRDALRAAVVDYYESYRTARGVSAPRAFTLVIGRRRD